eukprot:485014-Rhodomonas_salina.2
MDQERQAGGVGGTASELLRVMTSHFSCARCCRVAHVRRGTRGCIWPMSGSMIELVERESEGKEEERKRGRKRRGRRGCEGGRGRVGR